MKYFLNVACLLLALCFLAVSCQKDPQVINVSDITLSSTSLSLTVGDIRSLTATVSPDNATNKKVIWSSSDATIASVDNGNITAESAGSALITAKSDDGGKTATCLVTVTEKTYAVESVSFDKTEISFEIGDEAILTVTILPENATNKNVAWSSSNPQVATVNQSGVVAAVDAGAATITAKSDDGGKTATCEVVVKAKDVVVSGVTLDKTTLELEAGSSETLTATITPSNATNQSVRWASDNEMVASVSVDGLVSAMKPGKAIITVTTVDQEKTATCMVLVKSMPEAVDLGLSVKWASFNLGATKPEEYGGYFQWAGTEDVSNTSIHLGMSNCPYHNSSSASTGWTRYVSSENPSYWSGSGNPDNKTVLDPEDDAAQANLGGNWRMPTEAEFDELCHNCTSEWTIINGVAGLKFTSSKNGNIIFLPAAGYRHGTNLDNVGVAGAYWSSSLFAYRPDGACGISFDSELNGVARYIGYRYCGLSVRPVFE